MASSLPPSGSIRQPTSGWTVSDGGIIRRRAWSGMLGLTVVFCVLLGRLWFLQVVQGAAYFLQAQRNRTAHVPLPAPRGLILDRRGVVLATSRSQHSIAVIPGALPTGLRGQAECDRILGTLSFLLDTTTEDIKLQLKEAADRGSRPFDPVVVGRGVDLPTITLIEENKPRLGSAVLVADDLKRQYPLGALACHVLGYTGQVTSEDLERARETTAQRTLHSDDVLGKSGIEKEYDDLLAGTPGSEEWEVDSKGRPLRPRGRVNDLPGATLQLTLDAKLQAAAEQALGEARNNGALAAIDPRTGAILALASRPNYDPNIFSLPRKEFKARYQGLVADQGHPFLNRPVSARFPPGSTFKMITASAGLQKGVITPSWTVTCGGGLRLGRWFGCWQNHGSGVNLFDAFAKSCDVYFYQMSLRLGDPESAGPTYLAKTARQFGLGSETGIDLPSDSAGLIPDPAWRQRVNKNHPALARWFPGNTLNMSIGQGDVLVTPLQMALATGAVANGGTLWRPHLLDLAKNAEGKVLRRYQPVGRSVEIDSANLALVRQSMREVITRGTGRGCALPQVEIAGKTGSAEDDHHGLPHAWWVCFAPYKNPTIAIAVMVENSGHGSENAAPIAKNILNVAFPMPAHR